MRADKRKTTRHKFRNFGLNPKTKWKLLISLALILPLLLLLLLADSLALSLSLSLATDATHSQNMRDEESSYVRICIDSHLYQLCMCMFIFVQFLVRRFSSSCWIVIINLLRNFFPKYKAYKMQTTYVVQCHIDWTKERTNLLRK